MRKPQDLFLYTCTKQCKYKYANMCTDTDSQNAQFTHKLVAEGNGVYDLLYSAVHPMKYMGSDVIWYR